MKWTLIDIKQETHHPFLNFFTLLYDVEQEDKTHVSYPYFIASRHSKEELVALKKDYSHPDGVVMPLYYKDLTTGKISLLMTRQFRPSMGTYLTSFPAGLIDKNEDLFTAVKREAKEEAGVEITDLEILAKPGATSSGLSDEINCVVLGRITSFGKTALENCEDISTTLVPLEELPKRLDDDSYQFPINIRILCLYLLERFH